MASITSYSSAFSALLILSVAAMLVNVGTGEFVTSGNTKRTWCVAKPSSDEATLMANINFACSEVDCKILQMGYPCFYPDNLINHASIAMNLYYMKMGRNKWNCDFKNSALTTFTDPSYGYCKYH